MVAGLAAMGIAAAAVVLLVLIAAQLSWPVVGPPQVLPVAAPSNLHPCWAAYDRRQLRAAAAAVHDELALIRAFPALMGQPAAARP